MDSLTALVIVILAGALAIGMVLAGMNQGDGQ